MERGYTVRLHNHGEVQLKDWMGSDVDVINAARVSFGKEVTELSEKDKKLMKYLAANSHDSPFRHIMVKLRIKAPEFVMRQMYKSVVGIEGTSNSPTKDHAWNEISQRYVQVSDTFIPEKWRAQSEDNKQASSGTIHDQKMASLIYEQTLEHIRWSYETLIDMGVAKEQARMILPLSIYSEVIWTASFQALMNFVRLRDHDHAQEEIRDYAVIIKDICSGLFPVATDMWINHHPSFRH